MLIILYTRLRYTQDTPSEEEGQARLANSITNDNDNPNRKFAVA
jgi:hypothetical protein